MVGREALLEAVINHALWLDYAPCLAEIMRLVAIAVRAPGGEPWLAALMADESSARLVHVLDKTLNPILLERGLELASAVGCKACSSSAQPVPTL